MDKKLKLINAIKAGKIKNKKDLESFIIDDLKKTEIVNEVVAELPKIKSIKGEPGKDGEDGENGKTPTKKELIDLIKPLIPAPINGVDGISPTVDTDSIVTRATKLASDALKPLIPTSTQVAELLPERGDLVRNSLELLQGDERLSAEAIKGLPELTKEVSDYKVNAPSRGIFTYVGGAKKGLINTIDFIGVTHSKVNGRDTLTTTTPDLSGYLKLNQTTPQTTVGNFSFPSVSVTAGNMNQYSPMLFGDFSNTTGYIPIWNDGVGGFDSDSGLYYSTALREFQTPSIYASDGVSGVYLNDGTYAINATGKSYLNGAVTLGAGSATAGTAPLKFTSGTLTTVAVAGQLEYLSNRFYIRGTDKLTIGGNSGTYQLEIKDSDTATGGILVNTSTYVNIPNPGSVTEKAIFNARGFGFCVDTYTLGATFQPSLGIGLAGNRGPMLGIKASATGAAIAIEQGRIGVGTSGPQEPIDCIGNILTRSTSGTAYETRTRMVSTYYGGASNYASGGIEIDGVQAGVGYGLYGATRFYAGANTNATRGWAWKADGLLGVTTLAASGAQMVLNKSGYLGIGTATPNAQLEINNATLSTFRLDNANATAGAGASQMQFFANSSPSAANNKNFAINNVNGSASGENYIAIQSRNDTGTFKADLFRIYQNSGNVTIDTGNLGIGTVAPTAVLHLKAGTTTAGTAPIKLTTGNYNTNPEAGTFEWYATTAENPTFTPVSTRYRIPLIDSVVGGLTSGRVPFATTNGRLTDDADMTFVTDTLTVTKIKSSHYCADGTAPLANGTYTIFDGSYTGAVNGTITIKDGLITAYSTGGAPLP